jgi:hypothetical protein
MALNLSADTLLGGADLSPADMSLQFDTYLSKLDAVAQKSVSREEFAQFKSTGTIDFAPSPRTPYEALTKTLTGDIAKGVSAESLASIQEMLETAKASNADLTKDFNLTSPIPSGAVAFDLEAPMKQLTPKPTPLRNSLPRIKGQGTSHRFKALTGATGTGTGGVGVIHPGIADSTQTNFAPSGAANGLFYARGPKIQYAGIDTNIPYFQFSVSDEVTWSAQYAGQGYQDIRQVSRTYLLYSSMLLEERMLLYGRGTNTAFGGVLAAPTIGIATARAAAAGETAITGATTNVFVKIVAESGDFGVSQASAVVSVAVAAGQVVDITYTLPAGATGARMFVSTGAADPGDAARWLVPGKRSGYNKITLQGLLPTTGPSVTTYTTVNGATVNLAAADGGSAYANGYDGIWSYCTGPNAGYTNALNGTFSNSNPGIEFQNAFAAMFDAVKADPDRILMNGRDRKQLSETLKGNTAANYFLQVTQDQVSGATLGSVVPTIINEVTGKRVNVQVHPWLPQGNSAILSDTLPIPDTQVSNVWSVVNVQDYLGMDWPVQQFTFDCSSYWFGSFVCYAPAWNGSITGIQVQ